MPDGLAAGTHKKLCISLLPAQTAASLGPSLAQGLTELPEGLCSISSLQNRTGSHMEPWVCRGRGWPLTCAGHKILKLLNKKSCNEGAFWASKDGEHFQS